MKQTKEEMRIAISKADVKEWYELATSAAMREAKCHSLANDETKHPVFRQLAEMELETATRNAEGHLLALRAAITAVNIAAGMPDEKAQADADMLAAARVWHEQQAEDAKVEALEFAEPETTGETNVTA